LSPRRQTLAVATLVVALILEIVDQTIVNTALPAIKAGFAASPQIAEWVAAGYSLSFAMFLLLGGRLGDMFGYRRMFLLGVTGFTLASILCGTAPTAGTLVAARILQGVTGALMAPQAMAFMQLLFHPLERVSRMAMFGVLGGLAAIAGPVIGGLLINANLFGLGWRMVFLVNGPIGLVAVMAGRAWLPAGRAAMTSGIDWAGAALFALAMALLVWPMIAFERPGVGGWAAVPIVLALVTLGWVWRHVSRRVAAGKEGLLDPALFAVPSFRLGLVIATTFALANSGFLLVFAFSLQNERHLSALQAGLLHIPFSVGVMAGIALIGRRLLPRHGRWVLVGGAVALLLSASLVLLAIAWMTAPLVWLIPVIALAGLGMGTTSGCIGPITVAHVARDHAGAASGLLKTCQQAGAAAGAALISGAYFATARVSGHSGTPGAALAMLPALGLCVVAATRLPRRLFASKPAGHAVADAPSLA
jgi:EmrB/QacA subfamily drug resistance transporter